MYCDNGCLPCGVFLHYSMDPDVTLRNGRGVPPSCALLGRFAICAQFRCFGNRRLMQNVGKETCICCMAGLLILLTQVLLLANCILMCQLTGFQFLDRCASVLYVLKNVIGKYVCEKSVHVWCNVKLYFQQDKLMSNFPKCRICFHVHSKLCNF